MACPVAVVNGRKDDVAVGLDKLGSAIPASDTMMPRVSFRPVRRHGTKVCRQKGIEFFSAERGFQMSVPEQRVIPTLRITEYARSKAFYLERLGFKLEWEHRF